MSKVLHITVEAITGKRFKLRVSPLESIYFVKVKICQLEGIPISHQILIWNSMELNNDNTLSSYNIPNNSTFKLTLTMKGGPMNSILTDEPSFQDMVEYLTEPGDIPSSSSSSSSSLVSEKKHGALIIYRYGNHSLKVSSKDFVQPETYSVEKWKVRFEDLKLKNEKQVENNKLRGKMAALRKQMQKVALNKDKKDILPSVPDTTCDNPDRETDAFDPEIDDDFGLSSFRAIGRKPTNILEAISRTERNKISDDADDRLMALDESNECFDHSYSMKADQWLTEMESSWDDARSIRELMDLQLQNKNSSHASVSSSSGTNIEETSIDEEEYNDEDTSVLNSPNSISPEVFNELGDENNNCLPDALQVLQIPSSIPPARIGPSVLPDFPSMELKHRPLNSPSKFDGDAATVLDDAKDQRRLLPKLSAEHVVGSRCIDGGRRSSFYHNLLSAADPKNSTKSVQKPTNQTFLDVLRNNRLRHEREFGDIDNPYKQTCNRTQTYLDFLNKTTSAEIKSQTDRQKLGRVRDRLEDEPPKDSNDVSFLPKLPSLEPLNNSRRLVTPRTPDIRNGASNFLTTKTSDVKRGTCPYNLLPPIHSNNSTNQRCLPKLPSPRLSTRRESFSPFMKKRAGCLSNANNSCGRWRERHTLCYASDEEEEDSEVADDSACLEEDFPALEIPGSLLSSDLSGYRVKVKKFIEDRGLHSPNLMKVLEIVTRERQRSRVNERRTGYIISTSSDQIPRDEYVASSSEKITTEPPMVNATTPKKKKCGVCHKKTSLASCFTCRCGQNYCSVHRYPEAHKCTIDYKMEGRKILEERNPVVKAPKLPKI